MKAPQDLVDSAGKLVAAEGDTITQVHLARLARPANAEGSVADSLDQPTRDKIKKRLKLLFSAQDLADPMIRELFRLTYLRLAERLTSGTGLPEALKEKPRAEDEETDFPPAVASPQALVDRLGELAAFPDIYFRISETLQRPNVSAVDVSKVVSSDMILSARLLKVVNSPFYGFRAQVDTVHRAIALAGMNELLTMALGMTAVNYFQNIPVGFISLDSFWRHSVGCGILARSLADNMKDMNPERMFTAGLLHDIGRLVMAKDIPQLTALSMRTALEKGLPLVQAERKIFEFDHADVGGELLRQWFFPDILVSLVENHHTPMQSDSPREACLIRLADLISNSVNASRGAPYVLAPITKDITRELDLPPEALPAAMEDYDAQIADVLSVFT
jgi:putative nucleotidyltransferase with HDIG domain